MKTLNRLFTIGILALAFMVFLPKLTKAQNDGYISNQEFYDQLAPYGTWVQDDYYGDVWIPNVDQDFRPYATDGYWAQTDYGTTWVSDYPWGWATFHYGRWHYDDYYGWEWIPGHEWAPAWVSWRHGGGYYGWAPLDAGITISIAFGSGYHVPDNYWVCAPERYMNSPRIYNYYAPHTRVVNIIHNTTIVNNTYVQNNRTYIAGPKPADIQRVTHQKVTVYKINNAGRPGAPSVAHNAINIYRPAVRQTPNARPARVVNAQAYRQANPSAGIGHSGGIANNRANAQRLSQVAHSTAPDAKVVNLHPAAPTPRAHNPVAGGEKPSLPSNTSAPGRPQVQGPQRQQPQIQHQQQGTQQAQQHTQPAQQQEQQGRQVQQQGQQHAHQAQQQQQARQVQQQAQQHTQQAQQQQQVQQQQQAQQRQQQVQQSQQRQQQAQRQQQRAQQQQAQQAQQQQQRAQQQQQQVQQRQQQSQQQQQRAQQQAQQAQQQQQRAQQQQQQAQQRQQQAQQQQYRAQQQQQQSQQRQQQMQQAQQRQQQQQRQQRPQPPRPQPQPKQEQH